jgi:DNA replication protein DnaC
MRSLLVEESLLNESGLLRHVRLLFLDDIGALIIHAYVVMCMEALTQFKPMQYKSYT